MSYVTSLCCDSCDISSVVAGSDRGLLTVYRKTHTIEVGLHNSENVDLLAAACMSNPVLAFSDKSRSVYVFNNISHEQQL